MPKRARQVERLGQREGAGGGKQGQDLWTCPQRAHSLEPESRRGSLLVGTATFNSFLYPREGFTRTQEAGKQSTRRKAARPSGALWKGRISPSFWFGHSTCLFCSGTHTSLSQARVPFHTLGNKSSEQRLTLVSILSPKFVSWEAKPYSPRVNTE